MRHMPARAFNAEIKHQKIVGTDLDEHEEVEKNTTVQEVIETIWSPCPFTNQQYPGNNPATETGGTYPDHSNILIAALHIKNSYQNEQIHQSSDL